MKTALVTGGSRGIGLAIARCLRSKCKVIIASRTRPPRFDWFPVDVLSKASVDGRLLGKLIGSVGGIDILVNNVGGGGRWGSTVLTTEFNVYEEVYRKNAEAMIKFTKACLSHMVEADWGRVVTISSIYGKEAGGQPWFNMAKSAEISFMKSLSHDKALVRHNITFNTVCPGHISVEGKPDEADVGRFPMGRMGTAQEVASVVAFLCSDEATFVNGACIVVDGGESWSF